MLVRALAIAVVAAGLAPAAVQAQAGTPVGTWLTASGETRVRIAPCGTNLCGTVVWVKAPGKDEKNENASLRSRDLVGIRLVDMKPAGAGEWTGALYDYKSGKTYTGKMRMDGDKISMSGCVLGGMICQSSAWTRVN